MEPSTKYDNYFRAVYDKTRYCNSLHGEWNIAQNLYSNYRQGPTYKHSEMQTNGVAK